MTSLLTGGQRAKTHQLKSGMGVSLPKRLISINKCIKHLVSTVANRLLICIEQSCLFKLTQDFTQDLLSFPKSIHLSVSLRSLHFCHSSLSEFAPLVCVQASLQWFAGAAG